MLSLAMLSGCANDPPPRQPDYAAREVVELERWDIVADGRNAGLLRRYEIRDPTTPVRFWRIENAHGAWVGHVTDRGWFTRRVPFRESEEDLGIWPMKAGVARLLDAGAVELRPVALDAVMRKSDR